MHPLRPVHIDPNTHLRHVILSIRLPRSNSFPSFNTYNPETNTVRPRIDNIDSHTPVNIHKRRCLEPLALISRHSNPHGLRSDGPTVLGKSPESLEDLVSGVIDEDEFLVVIVIRGRVLCCYPPEIFTAESDRIEPRAGQVER